MEYRTTNKIWLYAYITLFFIGIVAINIVPDFIKLTPINGMFIGLIFLLLDYVHLHSKNYAIIIIAIGCLLTYLLGDPNVASASTVTFLVACAVDFVIFRSLMDKTLRVCYFPCAALTSNIIASGIDSILFSYAMPVNSIISEHVIIAAALMLIASQFIKDHCNCLIKLVIVGLSMYVYALGLPNLEKITYPWSAEIATMLGISSSATDAIWFIGIIVASTAMVIIPFLWFSMMMYKQKQFK